MAVNITKLAGADYYLDSVDKVIGEGQAAGADPVAYYARQGNPPGTWIGSACGLVGGVKDTQAKENEVRSIINRMRDPKTGRTLGDPEDILKDSGRAPVGGWDLTLTIPKSLSVLWAFGDENTRRSIDRVLDQARDMTIRRLETQYLNTRAGTGGVASVPCDGLVGFDFRHHDSRAGDPHIHDHLVISNRVRRAGDGRWTAIDGRTLYAAAVELSEYHANLIRSLTTRNLGWSWTAKPNRNDTNASLYEIDGVDPRLIDLYSTRNTVIEHETRRRIDEEERRTGLPADWRRREQIRNDVWQETRDPKPKNPKPLAVKTRDWISQAREHIPGLDLDAMYRAVNTRPGTLLHVDRRAGQNIGDLLLHQLAWQGDIADPLQPALQAMRHLQAKRATWTRANIRAEAERIISGFQIDPDQLDQVVDRIADQAISRCVKLTPTRYRLPDNAQDQPFLTGHDGRTSLDDPNLDRYTTTDILQAEQRVMDRFDREYRHGYQPGTARAWLDQYRRDGGLLSDDQETAVAYALEDTHTASSIIGPAGSGKTTAMKAMARAWEHLHGPDSVMGVALSNRAKDELHASIGCNSITIAKLLQYNDPDNKKELARIRTALGIRIATARTPAAHDNAVRTLARLDAEQATYTIRPDTLVIHDEAGMTGTFNMDRLTSLVEQAGAKLLNVGDPKQLEAPDGAAGILAWAERTGRCAHLTSLYRFAGATYAKDPEGFHAKWAKDDPVQASRRQWVTEADATMRMREGGDAKDPDSVRRCRELVREYEDHDRLHAGTDAELEDWAVNTARRWWGIGKSTIIVCATNEQVTTLNRRFLAERKTGGLSDANPQHRIHLRDGLDAGAGDQIVSRDNRRNITSDDGGKSIQNGTGLIIDRIDARDGTIHAHGTDDGREWTLPAAFVTQSCEAGYATTTHRSQGGTFDRAIILIPSTGNINCNNLYVGTTRGREENHICFASPDPQTMRERQLLNGDPPDPQSEARRRMLGTLLTHRDDRTAHETHTDELKDRYDLKRLASEHDLLAGNIVTRRLDQILAQGHDPAAIKRIHASRDFDQLKAKFARAYPIARAWTTHVLAQPLPAGYKRAETNPAAILAGKLDTVILDRRNGSVRDDWAAGIIPRIRARDKNASWQLAKQNETLLDQTADRLAHELDARNPDWAPRVRELTRNDTNLMRDIAVYRALWDVTDPDTPLGDRPAPNTGRQEQHWVNLASRLDGQGPGVVNPTHGKPAAHADTGHDATDTHVEQSNQTSKERNQTWEPQTPATPSSPSSTPQASVS